jgi:hypothetical protein
MVPICPGEESARTCMLYGLRGMPGEEPAQKLCDLLKSGEVELLPASMLAVDVYFTIKQNEK